MANRYKLGFNAAGLSLIIISMFCVTWYTTSTQKAEGLVKSISVSVENQSFTISEIDKNVPEGASAIQEITVNISNTSESSLNTSHEIDFIKTSTLKSISNIDDIVGDTTEITKLAENLKTSVDEFIKKFIV